MPQDVESEAELKNLAAVPFQLISPANNAPIIGIYQDSMLGCYRFTRANVNFTPRDAMNLLMMFDKVDSAELLNKNGVISSFDMLSQIMPPLTLSYKTKLFKDSEDYKTSNNVLEIRDGKYIRGQMDKGVLGAGSKGLIHRSCNDFGNMVASNFVDDLQNVITEYMKSSSFSVGVSDLISDEKTNSDIIKVITEKKTDVKNLIDQTQIGVFDNNTGKTNQEEFETRVNNILNQASSEAGKIGLNSLDKDNRFVIMVNAGSKGSDLNISQMISCLGQQNVDGKRIPYGFDQRTLPHFTKFDDSPGARGFVESSYINGLSPQELFFHAMGGRVGLIDTAVKTSSTGYIQRRLIKGLEDLMVSYDMTIRTNKNKIVQFSYGDDSIDTIKVENQMLPIVSMSVQDIYAHYTLPEESGKSKALSQMFVKNVLTRSKKQKEATMEKCKKYTEMMITVRDDIIKYVFKNKGDSVVNCPVAFAYIVNNIQGQQRINGNSLVDITPLEAFEMIEETYANLEKNKFTAPTMLFKTLYYYYLSPKELLYVKRFNRVALQVLLDTIVLTYKKSIVSPGEMVGMTAGQSIGETSTQMTLNSVTYETLIIVRNREGFIQKVKIGDFIEKHIAAPKKLEYYSENDTTYAEPGEYYEIPSCNEEGDIVWKEIEAVTRHPVVNKDGTNTMLKITTDEEREVIATKAKSFLKLVDGKIVPVDGDSLNVGDYLPVSTKSIDFTETLELDLREILPPTEYIYSNEVEKAKEVMHEYHWWTKHQGKTFTLPYKRSDSFVAKVSEKLRNGCVSKTTLLPGCVYMKQTNMCDYTIPEKIPLDYNFGYLIGAYAAEGCMTRFQMSIANNDTEYFEPILELCKQWNITSKVYRKEINVTDDSRINGTSQDLRIYNTVICRVLEILCGKLSHNKFISDKIIFSNKKCLQGFLDAYIGGDGHINKKGKSIDMSSVSKLLLIDVQQMLNILGICSKLSMHEMGENKTRFNVVHQPYSLFVRNKQAQKLANLLNMKLKYKQENLKEILDNEYKYKINKNYLTVPNEINGKIVFQERTNNNCKGVLFDKIKKIEEVSNTTNYAYDLTVKDTRNFNIYNGLALRDTFHFAGVSAKSNVTRGVPRIEEILSLSSEPKNPSLTVYLKKEEETDREKAQSIMYMLEHTKLQEVVKSVQVCFDPDDLNTLITEDQTTMEQYRAFEQLMDECAQIDKADDSNEKSKWIIRMEMDPTVMLEKNITMDDINFTLRNSYGDDISCVFSDYNSDKLVFRVRMNNVLKGGAKGSQKNKVNPLDQSDQIYILKNFQDQLLNNTILRGIKGINKVILRKIKDNMVESAGVYKKQDIWVLDTVGSNMMDVLALDYIDASRTFSNNIVEIYETLGIEAARQTIYNELVEVIEFDGTYINYHHFSVLCDRMTYTSKMISIFRHGINNDNIGPIAKASFEETPEMFLKAARHAELDTFRGVSANVMCGQEGFYGTSAFQVVLDLEEMMKLTESFVAQEDETSAESIDKMFGSIDSPDAPCSTNKLVIQNNVVSIKCKDSGGDSEYNPGF
jgi:DNA-directed RNA polymerase beta' subunit